MVLMEYISKPLRVKLLYIASEVNKSGTLSELKDNYREILTLINEE